MGGALEELLVSQVYTFILIFARVGAALMIMPGIGDSYVPARIRLLFTLVFAAILTPVISPYLPNLPGPGPGFLFLTLGEFVIGIFIGTIARILMTALDTAGMVISTNMGLANAQVFNPALAAQGSVVGAFLSVTGAVLLFSTQLHHLMIIALVDSYQSFSPGSIPATEGMAEIIAQTVNQSFSVGLRMAIPFIVVGLMIYIMMGILTRLMPQIQVFILALPLQIAVGAITMVIVVPSMLYFWLSVYQDAFTLFIRQLGSGS